MNNKKPLLILPFLALVFGIVSCGPTSEPTSSPTSDPTTENTTTNPTSNPTFQPSEYDENWVPGENAIEGAIQPDFKNPQGQNSQLNLMRKTQEKSGLPSLGTANILVVPMTFKGDKDIEKQVPGLDLSFSKTDITKLENAYFYNDESSVDYMPSVTSYYSISSNNKLNLSGVVSPVVEYDLEFTSVLQRTLNSSKSAVYSELIDYIYNYLFVETETYYIGDFDADHDGRIDAISVVLNYPFMELFGEGTSQSQVLLDFVGLDNVGFAADLVNKETTLVNSYSFISDLFRQANKEGEYSNAFIKNVGRMLGLDDYTDKNYNYQTGYSRSCFGYTDMMEGLVGDHSAFSKYQLGWIEPKLISANSLPQDGLEVEINDLTSSGDALLLYTGKHNMFGEYLLIDMYYHKSALNDVHVTETGLYGTNTFTNRGVRVTKVDARLVRGYEGHYVEFDGETNFNDWTTLPNGKHIQYTYDYAYTCSSTNKYYEYGITANYPLVNLLKKDGTNRHLTYSGTEFTHNDLWKEGDVFASTESIDGFYKNFRFDGLGVNGPLLNINFQVKEFINGKAILNLWREN